MRKIFYGNFRYSGTWKINGVRLMQAVAPSESVSLTSCRHSQTKPDSAIRPSTSNYGIYNEDMSARLLAPFLINYRTPFMGSEQSATQTNYKRSNFAKGEAFFDEIKYEDKGDNTKPTPVHNI